MELSRQERLLAKPKNWGAITFQNIHKREQEIAKGINTTKIFPLESKVRKALESHPTVHGPLDATDVLETLSEDEQCSFFSEYPELEILTLRSWATISQNVLRCISISFSEHLLELDLSKSAVQAHHLELLFVRASNLQSVKLNDCNFVDVQCSIIIVNLLFRTLKELYLSKCPQMTNECLIWFGGGSAISSQSLYKLRALDLSWNESIDDKGIAVIASSCKKLTFLNLENCSMISDKGLVPLIEATKAMHLANFSGLFKLTNKSAIAIGKCWPELMSLNLSRCCLISDKGIKQIALGCKNLQAINIAGLLKLSEESMFCLADQCKGLMTLNMTGCERITMNGLDHLVRGLDYVEKGITFMGFKPIDQHVEKKLDDNLKMIKRSVTKRMEEEARLKREREQNEIEAYDKKINHAASVIQSYIRRYTKRMYFYGLWRLRLKRAGALTIQRVYRGYRGRIRAFYRKIEVAEFLANTPYAIIVQRNVRGHLCRLKMKKVSKAIREMYMLRRKEVEFALMVKIQAQARCFLARKRVESWRELCNRRRLNVHHAVLIIQQFGRFVLAKVRTQKRRIEKKNRDEARRIASMKIYVFCVEGLARYKSRLSGEELRRYYRHKWTAAVTVQRYYRGYKGREKYQKQKISLASEYFAAREIQRIFRGSRVLFWKDMRLNVIAAYVLDRHYVERQRSIVASRNRYKAFTIENQKDSASEPDEEDDGGENPWVEGYDKKKNMRYWQNFITNEITFDEPMLELAHEKGMIGKRVKVYWVVQAQWYEGTISRYHKRKNRHRIEYDDGDHEWMNLDNDCDRIQVQMPDGTWTMVSLTNIFDSISCLFVNIILFSMYYINQKRNWTKCAKLKTSDNVKISKNKRIVMPCSGNRSLMIMTRRLLCFYLLLQEKLELGYLQLWNGLCRMMATDFHVFIIWLRRILYMKILDSPMILMKIYYNNENMSCKNYGCVSTYAKIYGKSTVED